MVLPYWMTAVNLSCSAASFFHSACLASLASLISLSLALIFSLKSMANFLAFSFPSLIGDNYLIKSVNYWIFFLVRAISMTSFLRSSTHWFYKARIALSSTAYSFSSLSSSSYNMWTKSSAESPDLI